MGSKRGASGGPHMEGLARAQPGGGRKPGEQAGGPEKRQGPEGGGAGSQPRIAMAPCPPHSGFCWLF